MARKRKAGDGTVRQRKDGRWEGRVVIGYDDNGYPKTKNVLAKTKKECVEKLQNLKEDCGGLKPEKVRPEMPFGDWLTYWYENHSKPKIRPTTQETYESRIRLHIIPEIGSIPMNKLTQNDLQQFCSPTAAQMILCDGMGTGRPAVGNLRIHVPRKSARFQCGRGGEHGTHGGPPIVDLRITVLVIQELHCIP